MTQAPSGPENRLARESSPYLLLHRTNPVDWFPWGEEALEKAREETKPIFLSVGYSTCFWCHVMERESFADPEVARFLNEHFVSVKVDREERPDVDEIYMTATQLLTQSGGWPNSVFLTPDLEPFYAGTYFPPESRHGLPSFRQLIEGIAASWRDRREDVVESANRVAKGMRWYLEEQAGDPSTPPGEEGAQRALAALSKRFDRTNGGFGTAPKFPTPSNLFLLEEMREAAPEAGSMLTATLDAMARGGLYDQLAGGFHRYATDEAWRVPHFEKMLYDNGFLLEAYAREHARSGDGLAGRVVRETAAFLEREMTAPEGGFWSAIDAETEGREGAFYAWTREQLAEALSADEAAFAAPLLGVDGAPFFEGDAYVLHLPEPLTAEQHAKLRPILDRLREARAQRLRPATDDKVLTDWNGIAIAGLATAGRLLEEPALVAQAARAASFVLEAMRPAGSPLLHSWRQGTAKVEAMLGDYAFLVRALLALAEAGGGDGEGDEDGARWLAAAVELSEEQVRRLRDPRGGYFAAAERSDLLTRSKDAFDGAAPSPNAIAALNLLTLARLTGEERWTKEAEAALASFAALVGRVPEGVTMMTLAARRHALAHGGSEPAAGSGAVGSLASEAEAAVEVSLEVGDGEAAAWRPFTLTLAIAAGWHVNAHPASAGHLVATAVEGRGVALRDLAYPQGEDLRPTYAGDAIAVYTGAVEVTGELRTEEARTSDGAPAVLLTYQLCDATRCLPPVKKTLELPAAGSA